MNGVRISALFSGIEIKLAYLEARLYKLAHRRDWVSNYVNSEMNERTRENFLNKTLSALSRIFRAMDSSTISTNDWKNAFYLSIIIILFPILLLRFFQFPLPISNSNIFSILSIAWQVLASVIGISFVLVIFLVEYLHKEGYESQIFPLFSRYTKFHFIVIFGLVTLADVGLTLILSRFDSIDNYTSSVALGYSLLLLIANLFLMAFLYGRTFEFIRQKVFLEKLNHELSTYTTQSVVAELRRRLGNNLLSDICKKIRIEFTIFPPAHRNRKCTNIRIRTNNPAVLADIHIGLIRRAARLADINQETDSEESSIIWFSQIGKIINKENDEIACVSGKAENVRTRAHLGMAVKLRHPSDRIPDIVSENLQLSRDEMIEAIHSGNVTTIQLLLKRYISIIRSFLSAMSDYDVRFTMDMVESDSRLFSDWYVLSQIERDYYIILEEALRSTNREIIYHVIAFPMDVVYIADEYKDHLVFRRFARFFPDMYTTAARLIEDISIKELVNDRVWRVLQEYTNFRIISRLEDSDISDKDITTYGGYALEIAFIFNSLLKFSIDLADIKQFEAYGRAFNELMNSINWIEGIPSDRIDDLVFQLHYEKDKTLRKSYEEELSKKKAVAKIEGNFNQTRELIWLGIGGWLAHLVNSNKLSPENYKNFAAVVAQAFPNLETLYKIYSINSSNDKVSRFWTSWRLQELDEEEKGKSFVGGHIEDDSWITRYYCQRGIELSPMSSNSMPKIMPIYSERDIFTEVSKDTETFRTSETWKKTFDFPVDQIGSRINAFVEIHRNISELKKEIEEDEIIHATIDSGLVSEFKSKVMETWEKTQILRSLMIKFGKYEERPDDPTPEDAEAFGFNILEPKAAFIKQNKIHFLGWGEEHGRRLGMSEDARLSEVIIKSLPLVKTNLDRLDDTIYHNLNNLRANGSNPIILYSIVNIRNLNKSKRYKPEWRIDDHEFKDIDGFNGTFDGAAIFSIRKLGDQNILMLDFSYFAKLVQYRFEKGSDYPLSITIEPMDETKADKLLTNQPDLLIDKNSGNKIERETAVRNLFQKVHLQILEKSRLEDINPNCGIRIEIKK